MSLKRNMAANFLGQAWTALMSLLFVPLYIKYLGMEAYGLIGVFAMIQAWLSILDMGMTPTLGREMARYTAGAHTNASIRVLLRSLEWIFSGIFIFIFLLLYLSAGFAAQTWLKPDTISVSTISSAFTVMALVAGLRFLESLYRSAILGLQKQVLFNGVNSFWATIRGLGAVAVLAWISPTIKAFFLWQAVVSALTAVSFVYIVYSSIPGTPEKTGFSGPAVKKIFPFAGGVLATTFLALLLTQADKVILSKMLSLKDFGFYSLSGVVAGVIYYISGPVTQAFTPGLAQLVARQNHEELVITYHRGSQIVNVLTSTAAAILIFFGNRLISIWTGDPLTASRVAPVAALLGVGTFLNCTMHMPYMLQLAYGWPGLAAKVNFAAVIILIPSVIFLTAEYGIMGAASVWVVLNAGYVIFFIQLMHRRIIPKEKIRWYVNDFLLPSAASFSTAFAFSMIDITFNSKAIEIIFVLVCGALTALFSAFSADRIRCEFLQFIKRLFKKKI